MHAKTLYPQRKLSIVVNNDVCSCNSMPSFVSSELNDAVCVNEFNIFLLCYVFSVKNYTGLCSVQFRKNTAE